MNDEDDAVGPIEDYTSWRSVDASIVYGAGIPQPMAEVQDDEQLCTICALNESPGPVNGADIAELTDVMQEGFEKIECLLYRHLPFRKKLWWRLTDFLSKRG